MTSDDLKDPAVRAFIINATVNGLKTEINSVEERHDFSIALVDIINENLENTVFAHGDEDGILIEDAGGVMVGIISVLSGIIKFRQLLSPDEIKPEYQNILGRAIITTIGVCATWHGERAPEVVKPAGGLGVIHGGRENKTVWDDTDGFGIT